jgi:type II secretory pathway component GspD/PulD (secretin)
MTLNSERTGRRSFVVVGLAACLIVPMVRAQSGDSKPCDAKAAGVKPANVYETISLTYATQQNDLNDIQTDLRNMLPKAKIYGNPSQRAISLWATAEDMAVAHKVVADLDRPKKSYRLTYTITETGGAEGDKPAGPSHGSQHFALVAVSGEKTDFKEGSRVPLVTGTYDPAGATPNSQVQYIDVGLNIEATVDGFAQGVQLRTKIEESKVAEEKSGMGAQDPVIRQTKLEDTSTLAPGKAVVLGTMDVPGSGRKREISVVVEAVL